MRPNHEAAPARRHPLTIHCAYDALRLSFAAAWNPQIRKGFRFTIGWFDWCGVGKGDGDAQRTSSPWQKSRGPRSRELRPRARRAEERDAGHLRRGATTLPGASPGCPKGCGGGRPHAASRLLTDEPASPASPLLAVGLPPLATRPAGLLPRAESRARPLASPQAALMATVTSAPRPASGRAPRDPVLPACPHVVRRGAAQSDVPSAVALVVHVVVHRTRRIIVQLPVRRPLLTERVTALDDGTSAESDTRSPIHGMAYLGDRYSKIVGGSSHTVHATRTEDSLREGNIARLGRATGHCRYTRLCCKRATVLQ